MNQDEVLETLHRVVQENKHYTTWTVSTPHLIALVREVIEQEREECAKVCETFDQREAFNDEDMAVADACATAIRARGQA
jgi:predicted amino acid racemase